MYFFFTFCVVWSRSSLFANIPKKEELGTYGLEYDRVG